MEEGRHDLPMNPSEIIFSVEEATEGGFTAKALGYSIFTQAEDIDDLREKVREGVRCHFDEAAKPSVIRLHMVKDERELFG